MVIIQVARRMVLVSLVVVGLTMPPPPQSDARTSGALRVLRTVRLGLPPTALAVDSRAGRVFVVADDGVYRHPGRVFMLDAASGALLRTQRAGVFADAVAVDEQTARAFVTDAGAAGNRPSVLVLATTSGAPLTTTVLAQSPAGLAVDRRAGHVFVATISPNQVGRTITMLDARSGALLRTITTAGTLLGVDEASGRLFAASQGEACVCGGVSVLDTRSGTLLHQVAGPFLPAAVAVDARRGEVFVLMTTLTHGTPTPMLLVLDARRGTLRQRWPLGSRPASPAPPALSLAVDERTGRVVVSTGQRLLLLAATSGQVQATIALSGLRLLAVDERSGQVCALDTTGRVMLLSGTSGRVLSQMALGADPVAVALDARTRHLFVATAGDASVSTLAL